MTDPFDSNRKGLTAPGDIHTLIVASLDVLDPKPRSIRCDVAGTITIEDKVGTSLQYNMVAGEVLTFRGTKVTATAGGGVFVGWY